MLNRAMSLDLVLAVLWIALVTFATIELLRAVLNSKPLAKFGLAGRKPVSCNVCIAFWLILAAVLWLVLANDRSLESSIFVAAPSYGLAIILLRRFGKKGAAPLPE
jgi:hypothetical protein